MADIENKQVKEVKEYKGKQYGKRLLNKDALETITQLEEQAAEAAEKGKKKSLWSNIGAAAGTLVTGAILASNPLGWAATAAAMGGGSYGGSLLGRGLADATEKTKLSKMKALQGGLMRKSKESQAASFKATDEAIEKSARMNAMTTAVIAGWTTGGGAAAGDKLKDMGVSDKITQSKPFSKWGGASGTPAWGSAPKEDLAELAVKDTTLLESYERSKKAGFIGDYDQWIKNMQEKTQQMVGTTDTASITSGSSPQTVTSSSPTNVASSSNYTGSSAQNRFISSQKGFTGQSLVDDIKTLASKGQGGYTHSDSSFVSRGGMYEDLGGDVFVKEWLKNPSIKV